MTASLQRMVASAPRGFGDLLARELIALGATNVRERAVGVQFDGTLEVAYRACLESRVASRVFWIVAEFVAGDEAAFYALARELPWSEHIDSTRTLACDFSGNHPNITHTRFGALRLKDAICDRLRDETGARPHIAPERPAVRVHAHANATKITVSIDLSGEGLHRRGYRTEAGEAPLRENLAAGLLVRAGWPEIAKAGAEFLDPMCGSGTFVIEAALIAANRAPGANRHYYGFFGWRGHDARLWQRVKHTAAEAEAPLRTPVRGLDIDENVLATARANAERAGIAPHVEFERMPLAQARPRGVEPGFVATNPPYGVRLEDRERARALMRELGTVLREHFEGWRAAILAGSADLGLELGLRAERVHTVWNGALECRWLRVDVAASEAKTFLHKSRTARIEHSFADSPGAKMFGNRLAKNDKALRSWAGEEGVSCYRLYDADMPEYSFAVDRYQEANSERVWIYVQEYAPPKTVAPEAAQRRRNEALAAIPATLGIPPENIHLRVRRRTARGEQYQKVSNAAEFLLVTEDGLKFWVNFTDYLDTGLFLDHRLTRARLRAAAERKHFLNLFAYTGSATVYAAAGRARTTTTIDMSATYLDWAQRNLAVNGFAGPSHRFLQADCVAWLKSAVAERECYDLIFLDPPTFSNSKRMADIHDVQRDHADLIHRSMALLAPQGLLVFSTNAQRFKLDPAVAERYQVADVSRATLPRDFERNAKIHQCYEIRAR